jgi:transitional endoplasmic reticulum ATPase
MLSFAGLFLMTRADLSVWPILSVESVLIISLVVAALGTYRPVFAFMVFAAALSLSLSAASVLLSVVAIPLLGIIGLAYFYQADSNRASLESYAKLLVIVGTPVLYQHGWLLLDALVLALLFTQNVIGLTALAGIFGWLTTLVAGQAVPGVFAAMSTGFVMQHPTSGLLVFLRTELTQAKWSQLIPLIHRNAGRALPIIAMLVLTMVVAHGVTLAVQHFTRWRYAIATGVGVALWLIGLEVIARSLHLSLLSFTAFAVAGAQGLIAFGVVKLWKSSGVTQAVSGIPNDPEQSQKTGASQSFRKATWDDIAGYDDIKAELREAFEPYTNAQVRKDLEKENIPIVRGVLLYGPPGTGKTLFARALATETHMHFISVAGPEFLSKWVGESESKLRDLFAEAKASAPSVIFFDEIESILTPRDQIDSSSGGVDRKVVATFLAQMDGLMDRGDVLIIAATNWPDQIDSAAIRPGRFDKVVYISPPDFPARRAIFYRHLSNRSNTESLDVDALAAATERFTPADIENIIITAYRGAAQQHGVVTQNGLMSLIKNTKPTVSYQMLERYAKLADQYGRRSGATEQLEVIGHEHLTWDDIGGMSDVKATLHQAVELPLTQPELFNRWGIKPHKGVLLFGPPGCGKTLIAKVVADTASAKFYTVNGPELLGGGSGAGESRLRAVFERALENKPAVIFFDEIDAIAGSRDGMMNPFAGQLVTQLLTLMDGKTDLSGVVVLAATNRPQALDPALLRAGRFDKLVLIDLPDLASREQQWHIHMRGKPGADTIDYQALALESEGYSGAEIAHVVNAASLDKISRLASDDTPSLLSLADLQEALSRVRPETSPTTVLQYQTLAAEYSR